MQFLKMLHLQYISSSTGRFDTDNQISNIFTHRNK